MLQRRGCAPCARRRADLHQPNQQFRTQFPALAAQAGCNQRAAQRQPQIALLLGPRPEPLQVAQIAAVAALGGIARRLPGLFNATPVPRRHDRTDHLTDPLPFAHLGAVQQPEAAQVFGKRLMTVGPPGVTVVYHPPVQPFTLRGRVNPFEEDFAQALVAEDVAVLADGDDEAGNLIATYRINNRALVAKHRRRQC
jgi:hypothetical protein